ncbi:hypothetical protein A0H81_00259 [Grifola frondosa]|uniref:E3 ubiquitin-protein ligase n=1 Tax=Grifola frondosa TaxID=5627 RepID=A0A1C7MP57_GRIFR|nr:hypothetical protein A0H81_00259 [Grifola frondosa]
MPGSRKYIFTPATRAEILSELYDAFWGPEKVVSVARIVRLMTVVCCVQAQQPGGCCDCGDPEAWRLPINCSYHPPFATTAEHPSTFAARTLQGTPKPMPKVISGPDLAPVKDYPYRCSVPPELRDSISRTIGYALDFALDTLDYSPIETVVPAGENDLRLQPTGDPLVHDQFSVIIWNDDKHSFDETASMNKDAKSWI